jgi:hypothetical protein
MACVYVTLGRTKGNLGCLHRKTPPNNAHKHGANCPVTQPDMTYTGSLKY